MRRPNWISILRWLLAAFFAFGGIGNIYASEGILADYQRWGYPAWFPYVTGALELATSILLMTRHPLWGAGVGSAVMAAAAATVLFHGEILHAIPPSVTLALSASLAALLKRTRTDDREA